MTKATNGMLCGTLTRAMMITGAVKAQMKLVSYLNQHLKRKREGGRRKEGERERGKREGGRRKEGERERERGKREDARASIGWMKELALTHAAS